MRNRSGIPLFPPDVIVSNCPNDHYAKNQDGPVEAGEVGVRCNREKHEDK